MAERKSKELPSRSERRRAAMASKEVETKIRTNKKRHWHKLLLTAVLAILLIGTVAAGSILTYRHFSSSGKEKTDDKQQALELKEKAARHMFMPDETPVVTEIKNAEQLKSQAFFKDVENGDQLLLFVSDARVVIYRPSRDILINAGPVVNDNVGITTEQPKTDVAE